MLCLPALPDFNCQSLSTRDIPPQTPGGKHRGQEPSRLDLPMGNQENQPSRNRQQEPVSDRRASGRFFPDNMIIEVSDRLRERVSPIWASRCPSGTPIISFPNAVSYDRRERLELFLMFLVLAHTLLKSSFFLCGTEFLEMLPILESRRARRGYLGAMGNPGARNPQSPSNPARADVQTCTSHTNRRAEATLRDVYSHAWHDAD